MRVAIVGLGLIGGSIALGARERLQAEVGGWDSDPVAVRTALDRGAISSGAGSLAGAVATAQAVFVAAPVDSVPRLVREVLAAAPQDCVVTDVGSTKQTIVDSIGDPRFIGGHPLAGAESSGVRNARADLFAGSTWYLCPSEQTAAWCAQRVRDLLTALGAEPVELDAELHDRLMATVSHLPHVFANVLVAHALRAGVDGSSGPSFRDATRVAGSNPAMWSSIFVDNRAEVAAAIDDAVQLLEEFSGFLHSGDSEAVRQWCERAAADRARLGR